MAERFDVVVAGSGMGGLTAASLLAARGFQTLILERRHSVGGYMGGFRRGPFRFDAACSFLGAIEKDGEIGKLLDEIGVDRAKFARVSDNFCMILPDGEVNTRAESYLEALATAFPNHRNEVERLGRILRAIGTDIDRLESLKGWWRLLVPFFCPHLLRYARTTVGKIIYRELHDPALRALTGIFPATVPPSKISLLFAATVLIKGQRGGLYYPIGGMARFARLIADAAVQHGAELRLRAALAAIEHDGRRVRAVRTASGERIETRAVVVNFNPADVLAQLEGPETRRLRAARRRTDRFRYSASAFIVYLGLKENPDWSNEFFFTTILETLDLESFYKAIGRGEIPDQGVVHLMVPRAADPGGETAGAPTAKIIMDLPYEPFRQWREEGGVENYHRRKNELADRLIERVSRHVPSLRGAIVFRGAATPLTLERWTGNRRGAIYGLEPTVDQFGPMRWPNAGFLKGLYFCGHYSQPSPGIVGTCYSGRFAAERLTRDLG